MGTNVKLYPGVQQKCFHTGQIIGALPFHDHTNFQGGGDVIITYRHFF